MIFLSLRVTADAEGGLKGPAQMRRSLRGLGGGSHQQARAGIYRCLACPSTPVFIMRNHLVNISIILINLINSAEKDDKAFVIL